MNEIIMLVDKGDCKFLFEKKISGYSLPLLRDVSDIDDVKREFFNKYGIEIDKFSIIEKTSEYTIIKAITKEKLNDEKYFCDVLNEILPNISNEKQIHALSKITNKIFLETINDSFWLGIILSVEDKVSNNGLKYILSDFLLQFSSIFCEEVINYNFGEIKDGNILHKEIKALRNSYLKKCPVSRSKEIKKIIDSMGINFDKYVFDIVVFLLDDILIDINSRMWNKHEQDREKYNSIIMSPRKWIKNMLPEIDNQIEIFRERYVDEFFIRFKKMNFKQKSYSTYKLFKCSTSYDERIYIMQRIGLLKTQMMLTKMIYDNLFIDIDEKPDFLDFDKFLIKRCI